MYQRRYDNHAPESTAEVLFHPLTFPSLLPLLGLSHDSEIEVTVKSAASLHLAKPMPAILLAHA